MLSKREIFERVKNHLLTQKRRAANDLGQCRYRTADGTSCAVGCLIADHQYTDALEDVPVHTAHKPRNTRELALGQALKNSGVPMTQDVIDMLVELQNIHDSYNERSWEEQLLKIERRL